MSFSEAGLKYLETAQNYKSMPSDQQTEARHMMQAYEKILKDSCPKLCMADLPLLLRLTETNQVIKMEDAELADMLFRRTIDRQLQRISQHPRLGLGIDPAENLPR